MSIYDFSLTSLYVCIYRGSTSEKYKAARNVTSIKCVTPDWITDSIEKGYALPYNAYQVKKGHSTPTKDESINPNFSVLSAIIPSGQENRTTLEDTVLGNCTEMNFSKANTNKRKGLIFGMYSYYYSLRYMNLIFMNYRVQ